MSGIVHFFWHAGPLLICSITAVVLLMESSGIPITNNTLLLSAGALASLGHVNIWPLTLAAVVGSIMGACLAYLIGLRGGRQFILRLTNVFHIEPRKVEIVERWFQQSGLWMIFLSRMTPYVRPFACFPAGMARMPFTKFLTAATSGSILWCCALLAIGWSLGKRWQLALHIFQHYPLPSLGVLLLLLAFYAWMIYLIKRSLAKFSSKEMPVKTEYNDIDVIGLPK